MAKFPDDFEVVGKATAESKVSVHTAVIENLVRLVVTHTDYKALEEAKNRSDISYHEEWKAHVKTLEELASLKARVRELVEADSLVTVADGAGHSFEDHTEAHTRFRAALEALK